MLKTEKLKSRVSIKRMSLQEVLGGLKRIRHHDARGLFLEDWKSVAVRAALVPSGAEAARCVLADARMTQLGRAPRNAWD